MPEAFDYVIVGAGTAGCLLANRLSADPGVRVLLIEAGTRDRYPWIHIPVGYLYCIGNPRTDWMYMTEPDPGLNGRALRYPRGRTLGGCSSINGMIYMRGQARDYDGWAEITGEPEWRWENVLPDFRRHEDHWRMKAGAGEDFRALHGGGGEWRVERQRLRWDLLDSFAEACEAAGIARTDDFNRGTNEGVGYFEVNQRNGWRWNTSKAFLRPVRGRRNLAVWTEAEVLGLALRDGHNGIACTGALLRRRGAGEPVEVEARREVILAAGAVNSPKLLQLSGIGPASLLREHGLAVRADLPGVGENLQDHLQIRVVFKVHGVKTLNELTSRLLGKAMIAAEYALRRTGPMSMAPSQLGVFTRSEPGREHPNLEFHVQPLSLEAFGGALHTVPAFTASVCNLNPASRGRIALRDADPLSPPRIMPDYLAAEEDRHVAAQSIRVARRIAAQAPLAKYRPEEWKPGPELQTDEDLARAAGDIATTIFHPAGTTAMGPDGDPRAVLDPRFRVRDGRGGRMAGLRVVDAGAMPTITSGNTNAPTLMMAEKAARWIREDA